MKFLWGTTASRLPMTQRKQSKNFNEILFLHDSALFLFSIADASLLMKIIRKGLVDSKNDLDIQRKDPNSPLYSVKTFEALHL